MAPVSALAACVGEVVELHGQSDTTKLATPAVQRDLLDRFGGPQLQTVLTGYQERYTAWTQARDELDLLRTSARDRMREADRLRFELDEIDAVGVEDGEDVDLRTELGRLEHAEALTAAATAAAEAVSDDGGARDALAAAAAALAQAAGVDADLDQLGARLESLLAEAEDVGLELHRYATGLELDPARLASLRERQASLVRLSRKYSEVAPGGIDTKGVAAYAQLAREQLLALDSGEDRAAALEAEVAQQGEAVARLGEQLRAQRLRAGEELSGVVAGHLRELAMEGASLEVSVVPAEPAAHGSDRIGFLLAANAGEPALPLGKAASGGERSRVALALRLALADADQTPVLVFDEVDAGIGGATATAVGLKLASLARGRQVMCVTHLPQLAAYADVHFQVSKRQAGERTVAEVVHLDETQRVAELSRMLSGTPDSAVAADHAAELLASARTGVR